MSLNQSRGERSEYTQYRKTGRSGTFNPQGHFSGGVSTKGGGGGTSSAPSNPAGRGYKKYHNNAPAVQSRARNVDSDIGVHPIRNGPHQLQQAHITSSPSNAKPTDAPAKGNIQTVSRPSPDMSSATPTSNVPVVNSESAAPSTPTKGYASKSFPLQFGSISPGFMNGVQIPARTSSAPPNLDEQKKAQARQDSLKSAATVPAAVPIPSTPKQHLPKKDTDLTNAGQAQPVPKSKRDTQVSAVPPVSQTQKPAMHPIPGMPVQLPFHQPQVSIQFGGPNPQIQSQAMSGTSLPLQMQMPLMGNPPMQQPMFIPGLQSHPMQSQGMLHQGQNFNFPPQMGHQIPPHLGGMGMNMAPQFPQQQAGKYGGSRKSVKITHPETHEELRLDSSPCPRPPHHNVPQSQPIPSFPPNQQMNFYSNSYSATPIYFPPGSSGSKNSTQVPSSSMAQPPRSYNQPTVKSPMGTHGVKEQVPSPISVRKAESSEPMTPHLEDSGRHQKEVHHLPLSSLPQSNPGLQTSSASIAPLSCVSAGSDLTNNADSTLASVCGSAPALTSSTNGARKGMVVHDSINDKPNQLDDRSHQDQLSRELTLPPSLTSQISEAEPVLTKPCFSVKLLPTNVATSETSNLTRGDSEEGKATDTSGNKGLKGVTCRQTESEMIDRTKHGEAMLSDSLKSAEHALEHNRELPFKSLSIESPQVTVKIENPNQVRSNIGGTSEQPEGNLGKSSGLHSHDANITDGLVVSLKDGDGNDENSLPVNCLSTQGNTYFSQDASSSVDSICTIERLITNPALGDEESALLLTLSNPDIALTTEDEDTQNNGSALVSPSLSVKDKILSENVAKTALPKGKKKTKELLRKAEAAGTSSDLYNAYKGPEKKKETVTAESTEKVPSIGIKLTSAEVSKESNMSGGKPAMTKVEPDDWEDAAETHLETSNKENQGMDGDGVGLMTKRYSRDFLLKFMEQCTDLPMGFEITFDIEDILMVSGINISCESYPSPGRNIDRPVGGSRSERRSGGDDDRWNKPSPLMLGRVDIRVDAGYANNMAGFRPGGGNYGVLRNPRAQTPAHYTGGILPMQAVGQSGTQRNNSDSDRWQRGAAFQKGLMSSPQIPPPVMHKADKKYEIGKVADEEEAKQRQLKSILNKLTPQNFEKLFRQVKEVNIDNVVTLTGVISQIFDKALMEPTFCEMYADFCLHLAADLPDLSVDNERITFKRLLLNKCQEEFERGEREEEEANKAEEGEVKQTADEREEKRLQTRRRMLGNIRLIGELYKKRMLTERIMHECINKLLGQCQNPEEENIEALCKLMSTIGEMIDHPKAKDHMDAYFDIMAQLSDNMKLSSRVRFMLKDAIDLRRNKWQQRRKVEGPKKIDEVHRDAAQERHAQASRSTRAPSMGNPARRGGPFMDFAPRAPSTLSSPGSHMGSFRGGQPQLRGYGSQDARSDDRHSFDNRTVSHPLPQRPLGDDSITLGPQGGLMSFRGRPSTPNNHLGEIPSPADARRIGPGLNGLGSVAEQTAYARREDLMPRYMPDRFDTPFNADQLHPRERNASHGNKEVGTDSNYDRSMLTSTQCEHPNRMHNVSSENVWTEEQLHDKSLAAIREFYSARDEKEVALCIKDLNAPSFYPSMISIWVTDSFERKDVERELLTRLLVNLSKPRDGLINKDQLIKGSESVLAVLEDAVNDAPRAAEFLGHIFARVILENIISLSEIGQLIYEGGEEPGSLVEAGLAAEVMGSILGIIKSDKGDFAVKEILAESNLKLEKLKPPSGSKKTLKIDEFM